MKKILAMLGVGFAAAVIAAPHANADPFNDYLSDISSDVNVNSVNESDFLIGGLAVCVDLLSGITLEQEYADIVDAGINADIAAVLIEASVIHLCPAAAVGRYS